MTIPTDTVQQHRKMGRGRTATWIALAVAAFLAVVWIAAPFASQGRHDARPHHWSGGRSHSLVELATELREHGAWLRLAGVSSVQTKRVAGLLDQHSPVFEDLVSKRAALIERAADVLTAQTLDRSEVDALRARTEQLAAEAIDASFTLITETSAELTPDQRADLIRHWGQR